MAAALPSHLLQNAGLYADRWGLLGSLFPNVVGQVFCEIGVATVHMSSFLIEKGRPKTFFAIDAFDFDRLETIWGKLASEVLDGKAHIQYYRDKMRQICAGTGTEATIQDEDSHDATSKVPNRPCDLVYIGSGHSFHEVDQNTSETLRIVKEGGIIVFNDYTNFDVIGGNALDVVTVANACVVDNQFQVLGLGLEPNMFCNFAILCNWETDVHLSQNPKTKTSDPGLKQRVLDFIHNDEWDRFFYEAVTYANFEDVPGDFLDFGVFGGRTSTIFLKYLADSIYETQGRKVIGFDSFQGLAADTEQHARWSEGDCALNNDPVHPILRIGDPVTPEAVQQLSQALGLPEPEMVDRLFSDTLTKRLETIVPAAIIHVGCYLYEAEEDIVDVIEPVLQPGTLIAFDDWFHFRGAPPQWGPVPYKPYGTFCNSFIMHKK